MNMLVMLIIVCIPGRVNGHMDSIFFNAHATICNE